MNKLEGHLGQAIQAVFQQLFDHSIELSQLQFQSTRKEFDGDLTLVVFPLLKWSKKSPEQTAQLIGNALKESEELVADFNVVKGFLNLTISQAYWLNFFKTEIAKPRFGFAEANSKSKVMIEYASPNTNKPLHLGHLRNIFLGHALAELLKANGHEVYKVQIINDRGIHICKSMLAWQKFGNGETPQSSGLKGDH